MSWWSRLFGTPTSEPLEQQIARAVADRLDAVDPSELATVVAGRMLLADTTAAIPMVAVRGTERIPTPTILTRPDPREPYRVTLEKIVNSLTASGMAWLRVYRVASDGYPLAVRLINPARVTYRLSATGDEIAQVWVDGVATDTRDLRWIPFRSDLGPIGTSPLQAIAGTLEQLASVYRFGAEYYNLAATVPPYALHHPNRLGNVKAKELSDEWAAARLERRPAVLSGGIDLATYQAQSAADAMLLAAIDSLDAAIGRALLIPPSLLNLYSHASLTYSTTLDEFRRWLILGLFPGYLSRIAGTFSDMLPYGTRAVFDTTALFGPFDQATEPAAPAVIAPTVGGP